MTLLVIGLVLFLGLHLVPALPAARAALTGRWGEDRYRLVFSIGSGLGLALIIGGYAFADRGPQWFAPFPAAIAAAPFAVTVAIILLAAANMPSHLRATLKHPMLLGTLLWAGVHLLANGDRRGTVLFGAFLAYAVVDLVSAIRRGQGRSFVPRLRADVMSVVGGLVVSGLLMAFHRVLFGPRVVAFGI